MKFDILGGSTFYRLLGRALDAITYAAKQSGIARAIAAVRVWMQTSVIIRVCTRIADGMGAGVRHSAIIARFLREDETGQFKERGLVFRGYMRALERFRRGYHALQLETRLTGSMLLRPGMWAILTVAAVPLLPTMAMLGLVVLSAISLLFTLLQNRERRLVYSAVNKYVWLYMLVYTLAILTSVTPRGSLMVGLITVCFVGFYQVLVSSITTKRQVRMLLGALAGAGALVSLYGIYQFLAPGGDAGAWLDTEMFAFTRVYSTLANPNVLGKYFLLSIPLAFAGAFFSRTKLGRLFFLGAGGLMCITLVLTYSRGAYLGVLFAAAIFLALWDRRFIVPGFLAMAVLFLLLPGDILNRIASIGDMAEASTRFRAFLWMGTLSMLQDYWLSGVGPGEAAWWMVYPAYALPAIWAPHSHNLFLQIMVDAGLPGLAVFLAALYQYFKATFAALRRKVQGAQKALVIASIASIVGFLVQSMTDYTFYNFRIILFFWGVLAVGVIAAQYDKLCEGGAGDDTSAEYFQ